MTTSTPAAPADANDLATFADNYRRRNHPPDDDDHFLTDQNRTGRISDDLRNELYELLGQSHMEHQALSHLVSLLQESKDQTMAHARATAANWISPHVGAALKLGALEFAINRAGTRAIMRAAADWPPRPANAGSVATRISSARAAENVLAPIMADRSNGSWTRQIRAIDLVATELCHYTATGEAPAWFIPAEMTVSEDAAAGHSIINPGPMPTDNDELTAYVARRMELFLQPRSAGNPTSLEHETAPLLFADLMLSPHVDWELAGYDGPSRRPIPNHQSVPDELRITAGPEPADHARLSYQVALQPHLAHLALQRSVSKRNAATLAAHMTRAARVMPPMTVACRNLPAQMATKAAQVRKAAPTYKPALRYDRSPQDNLALLQSMTANMKTLLPLSESIDAVSSNLVAIHLPPTLPQRANDMAKDYQLTKEERLWKHRSQTKAASTSTFGPQLLAYHPPRGRHPDSPEVLLLAEGLYALQEARKAIDRLTHSIQPGGPIPLDAADRDELRRRAADHLLNVLTHADWCITAGHLLLGLHTGPKQGSF